MPDWTDFQAKPPCGMRMVPTDTMTRAELNAKRLALLAEGEALEKEYARLRLTPADSPEHAAYRERLRRHRDHVRNYLRELQRLSDDP